MENAAPGSEIEAASVDEFLRLLGEREGRSTDLGTGGASGGAVFVARTVERYLSRHAHPLVVRRVVATFAHGRDRVSYAEIASGTVEPPEMEAKIENKQQEAHRRLRAEIARGLEIMRLDVPVREGRPRLPAEGGGEG